MVKARDFYLIKVYDVKGKYLGVIEDLGVDFTNECIDGIYLSSFSFWSKKNFVQVSDIVSLEDVMIVKKAIKYKGLNLKKVKDMDIVDMRNRMRGVLEDLIINKKDFTIKGIIMSSGIFDRIIKGKDILLIKECVIGEEQIIFTGNDKIALKSIPHNM